MMAMVTKCPSCGHDNRDEANYCLKCGVKIIAPPIHIAPETLTIQHTITTEPDVPTGCSFHPDAMASHLCGRCGRTLCSSCVRFTSGMVFCPLCWTGPVQPYLLVQGQLTRPPYPLAMPQRCLG
ncbi:zinc ribbon domain-containing protein [archaeon]|nr:MAG: zinc ribbon domain-containing protein [archaeon]